MLYRAKTDYELQLLNYDMNVNKFFKKIGQGVEEMWTDHLRSRKRSFARREERKRGNRQYDIDEAEFQRRQQVHVEQLVIGHGSRVC